MKTNKENIQIVEFNDGDFTSSEMNELMIKMIDDRINHQKIQYLRNWERNHSTSRVPYIKKIAELKQKKNELTNIIAQAKEKHKKVNIQDRIQFKLVS